MAHSGTFKLAMEQSPGSYTFFLPWQPDYLLSAPWKEPILFDNQNSSFA